MARQRQRPKSGGRRRFPQGHDYSPSNINTYRMCPKRLWYQKVLKLYDPAGPEAHVGTVYHSVMERAALARIDADGTEELADVAELPELMGYHEEISAGQSPWVIEQSRKKIEAGGGMDFAAVYAAEQPIVLSTGRWKFGGILDRVDVQQGEDGFVYVRLADYKTGYIPDYDEFLENPQVVLYMAWGFAEFAKLYGADVLVIQMAFEWPTVDFPLEATYSDGWLVAGERRIEIAAALRQIESEVDDIKSWTKTKGGKANVGSVHCSYCPYRDQCQEYQEFIRKPARVHPWHHLIELAQTKDEEAAALAKSLGGQLKNGEYVPGRFVREAVGELIAFRHQWASDAKVLDGARKEVDRFLIDGKHVVRRTEGDRFDDGAHEAYVRQDSTSSYPISVVMHMAKVAGVPLDKAVRLLCSGPGSGKIKAFIEKYPAAAGVADAYKTTGLKAPWIRVKAHGGLF